MKKIWLKFNDAPIFFRLSCVIVLVACALMFFSVANYVNISDEKIANIGEMVGRSAREAMNTIDSYVSDLYNVSKIPLTFRMEDKGYIKSLQEYNDTNRLTLPFRQMNELLCLCQVIVGNFPFFLK